MSNSKRARLKSAFQQTISGFVVIAMLAQNPVFAQADALWASEEPPSTQNQPDSPWTNDRGLDSSQRGSDYLWGNNPEPEDHLPDSDWRSSESGIEQGATQGQQFGSEAGANTDFPASENDGKTLSYGEGESVSASTIFAGRGTDESMRSAYGSEDEFRNRGGDARNRLQNDDSIEGEVYRMLETSADRNRPDFREDPAWASTDALYADILGREDMECNDAPGAVSYQTCRRNFEPDLPEGCGFDRELDTRPYNSADTVFSYKGCFDHNYIDIQLANAPSAEFSRGSGYRVIPGVANEINAQWSGNFRVRSNRGQGSEDHLSGIYYRFDPIDASEIDGVSLSDVTVQMRNISLRNNATFNSRVVRQPSPGNNWTARVELNDAGVSGGDPRCPHGRSDGTLGWVEFDLVLNITGTELSSDRWESKSPACEIADREYAGFCEKDYQCVSFESDNRNDQLIEQDTTATRRVSSRNYSYNEKTFPEFTEIDSIRLLRKVSASGCTRGSSYGIEANKVWVDNGCRADFEVSGKTERYIESGPDCIVKGGEKFCDGLAEPPAPNIPRGCMDVEYDYQCDFPGQDQPDTCRPLDEDPQCGYIGGECAEGDYEEPTMGNPDEGNGIPRKERNVFSFEGCFDHNRIEIPIAGAPEASFDARYDSDNPGYRVIPNVDNEIDAQWPGQFQVLPRNSDGYADNMSGVYYAFRPYDVSDVEALSPQDFDIELVNLDLRNNAPFNYDIVERPSASNGWRLVFDINDNGVDGGAPGCPHGLDDAPLGWAAFDLRVGFGDEAVGEEPRCFAWDETYRCETPQNNAACAAQDLMGEDFGECDVSFEQESYTKTVSATITETCQVPRQPSTCEISRDIALIDRTASASTSANGCFVERTRTVQPGWGQLYTDVSASVESSGSNVGVSVIERPSPENNWSVKLRFNGSKRTDLPEDSEEPACPASHFGRADITWTGTEVRTEVTSNPPEGEEWNSPCLRVDDGISMPNGSCQASADLGYEPHLARAMTELYPGEFDGNQFCADADIVYEPADNDARFCYERPNGETICRDGNPQADAELESQGCDALDQRVAQGECELIDTRPIGNGEGATGIQYYFENVYECSMGGENTKTIEKTRTKEVYECSAGGISCMGEDCVNVERDVSGDFEKAVGLLDTLSTMKSDMECSTDNPETCRVFAGEAQKCKQALGGWVDCCETPGGVSLSNYIALIKTTQKLDSTLMAADGMQTVQGTWKTIRDPAVNAFDASKEFFTSAMDNITGSTTEAATEAASEGILSSWKQEALNKTASFVQEQFGTEAANVFFKEGTIGGSAQLAPGFSTALSVIGTAYTIYMLTDLLVNIIWECSQKELQLGAERELQKTHYLGTYCSQDTFFGCIEEKKSYCVFNAPLPRIIQQQVRPQLGMSWGSAESPNCEGIPVRDLNRVNWNEVDLSEWTDLLDLTGQMPEGPNLTPENLTGSGSTLNNDLNRPDVTERTIERADGAEIGEQNEEARRSLWGQE
jgi:hypothetical protein